MIDFVRNMQTQMPRIIFYLSLVFNINNSFTKFSEEFLDLKFRIFEVRNLAEFDLELFRISLLTESHENVHCSDPGYSTHAARFLPFWISIDLRLAMKCSCRNKTLNLHL